LRQRRRGSIPRVRAVVRGRASKLEAREQGAPELARAGAAGCNTHGEADRGAQGAGGKAEERGAKKREGRKRKGKEREREREKRRERERTKAGRKKKQLRKEAPHDPRSL
jgi:hypothetical protein